MKKIVLYISVLSILNFTTPSLFASQASNTLINTPVKKTKKKIDSWLKHLLLETTAQLPETTDQIPEATAQIPEDIAQIDDAPQITTQKKETTGHKKLKTKSAYTPQRKRKKNINSWHHQDLPKTVEQTKLETDLLYTLKTQNWHDAKKLVATNVNFQTSLGDTILHYAVHAQHMPTIEWAIAQQANPAIVNFTGDTPLTLAAQANRINIVRALLKNQKNNIYCTLFEAPIIPHFGSPKQITQAPEQYSDAPSNLPIIAKHHAHRQLEIFFKTINFCITNKLITKNDLEYAINYPNQYGNTLLHYAAYYNHIPIVTWALGQGAIVNVVNIYGQTPITLAAQCKNLQTTKLLLKRCSQNIFCELINAGILPRIDSANQTTSYRPCDLLPQINQEYDDLLNTFEFCLTNKLIDTLELKKSINYQDRYGNTLLHYGAAHRHIPTIQWALEHGANQIIVNHENKTPLDIAANDGNVTIAKLLLGENAQYIGVYFIGTRFAADLSQEHKSYALQTLKFYVTHNLINLHTASVNGHLPINAAIQGKYLPLVQYCIENQPDTAALNLYDRRALNPLQLAICTGNPEIVETLIKAGASLNIVDVGNSLLDIAAMTTIRGRNIRENITKEQRIQYGIIERMIVQHGVQYERFLGTKPLDNALFFAARVYDWDTVKQLDFDPNHILPCRNTILHYAVCDALHTKNLSMVDWLLQRKANPTIPDSYGQTPLAIAVKQKNVHLTRILAGQEAQDVCIQLIQTNPVPESEYIKDQENLLLDTVIFCAQNEIIYPHKASTAQQFPLHTSIKQNKHGLTKWLINELPPKTLNQIDFEEMTPLALAITHFQSETVKQLLAAGAQANQRCRNDNSPLDFLVIELAKIRNACDDFSPMDRQKIIKTGLDIENKLIRAGGRISNVILANAPTISPIKRGEKIGPNDPCPCASGKKFKKCCSSKT